MDDETSNQNTNHESKIILSKAFSDEVALNENINTHEIIIDEEQISIEVVSGSSFKQKCFKCLNKIKRRCFKIPRCLLVFFFCQFCVEQSYSSTFICEF